VLVVDNDAAVLKAMQVLLEGWGCDVQAARTHEEALAACRAMPPELLMFDYHLDGGLTGLALREQLGDAVPGLPCIIITADHDPAIRADVEAAGCHLLYKPLKPLALKSVMARVVSRTTLPA
jgi:CheY-like chemotaxis protein